MTRVRRSPAQFRISRAHSYTMGAPGHKFASTPARRLSAKKEKCRCAHTHIELAGFTWARNGDRSFCGGAGTNKSYATLGVHLMIYECTRVTASRRAMQIAALHIPSVYICAHARPSRGLAHVTLSRSQSAKGKAPREPSGVREAPLNWRPHSLCDPNSQCINISLRTDLEITLSAYSLSLQALKRINNGDYSRVRRKIH